jgi:signal transduction histidine kinase
VSWLLAVCGWSLAGLLWRGRHRRGELVADAEHELRGPTAALALVCERMRRRPGSDAYVAMVESQLARLRIALDDLALARQGRRSAARVVEPQELQPLALAAAGGVRSAVDAEWDAGVPRVVADRGRLAQALGNLLANADEHGDGPVELRGRRVPGAVRIEVRNRASERRRPEKGRGRGLRIARSAAAAGGGRLEFRSEEDRVVAALELPVEEPGPRADAA